ncbi:MAG: hypothetical protein ACRC5M_05470 [Anaeroplasmataceae bacterium]
MYLIIDENNKIFTREEITSLEVTYIAKCRLVSEYSDKRNALFTSHSLEDNTNLLELFILFTRNCLPVDEDNSMFLLHYIEDTDTLDIHSKIFTEIDYVLMSNKKSVFSKMYEELVELDRANRRLISSLAIGYRKRLDSSLSASMMENHMINRLSKESHYLLLEDKVTKVVVIRTACIEISKSLDLEIIDNYSITHNLLKSSSCVTDLLKYL